jgi:small subunit ribosomal protein S1
MMWTRLLLATLSMHRLHALQPGSGTMPCEVVVTVEEALAAEAAPVVEKAPSKPRLGRGARCDGVVDRIERYGVFLNLFPEGAAGTGDALGTALMPASETGTPRGSDLGKAFPLGMKVPVLVIDVDDRGRLKASKTAREQADERAVFDQFKSDKGAGGKAGLGTFGDLLKKKFGG